MQSDLGKLFIGGISWDTNEDRLKDYFSNYGEVVEAVIMKDRTTGRARGFGFVVFADPAVAERVIKEKHNIDGRMVEAKKAVPKDDQSILSRNSGSIHGSPGPGRTRKIFVGGLASTVTESDFKKYFDQFGAITDVVVMYDHNTQRPRGFGFITYESEEAVDKVLLKTFHELNGKMVEVKRAVPKELSPGPIRSQLGGFNYGLSRVNSFLSAYNQGYAPSTVGGYGVRMDGRFSLSQSYGGSANFNNNLNYGRGLNPYYIGNTNRFNSTIGYDGGNGGNSSFFSSATRNLWGAFGNSGTSWGSSLISAQVGGYGRNSGTSVAPTSSYAASNSGYDGALAEFYSGGSVYGDSTWRPSNAERDGSGSFGYGLGNAASDVPAKSSPGYVGGYSVTKRQSNRGIAA
ncbi:unnamed protein product, partial [Vitis vinifera]